MSIGIYKITYLGNDKNKGKCYIGLSKNIERRKKEHESQFKNRQLQNNKKLYFAIEEHGWENFSFEILEQCVVNDLSAREKYYIQKYNSYYDGYNLTLGGEGVQREKNLNRFNLQSDFLWRFEDCQKYVDPAPIEQKINDFNLKIKKIKNNKIKKVKKIEIKVQKFQLQNKLKKITYLKNEIINLNNQFILKLEKIDIQKNHQQNILNSINKVSSLKNEYFNQLEKYVKKSFEMLKEEIYRFPSNNNYKILGPSYNIDKFQENNQSKQNIQHFTNYGNLTIYSEYLSFKPNIRRAIKLYFEDLEEIYFEIWDENIQINFNGTSKKTWDSINKTYKAGYFNFPSSFYLIFNNDEFNDLIKIILNIKKELWI